MIAARSDITRKSRSVAQTRALNNQAETARRFSGVADGPSRCHMPVKDSSTCASQNADAVIQHVLLGRIKARRERFFDAGDTNRARQRVSYPVFGEMGADGATSFSS